MQSIPYLKNKFKKHAQIDLPLLICVFILLTTGLVMVYSASSVTSFVEMKTEYYFVLKQAQWAFLGIIAMYVTMSVDYHVYRRFYKAILIVVAIMLVLVLVPGIGVNVGGSSRWLDFVFFRVQPSEIAKLASIFFAASFLSQKAERIKDSFGYVMPPFFVASVLAVLILVEPDMGTASVLVFTTFILLVASGAKYSHVVLLFSACVVMGGLKIVTEEYQMQRIHAFLKPWENPQSTGYQIIQSLFAVGSGGIWGIGLGNSRQKLFYLPEQHTDFIFAIICEELGFIGASLIIGCFACFIMRGCRIAMNAKDSFGSLLAIGITSMIGLQVALNIAVVTKLFPITGLTLPLISYGGSSLMITLASIGILLNISKNR